MALQPATVARFHLQLGACETEREHGVSNDQVSLIVGDWAAVTEPLLEFRTERHPPAGVQRAEFLVCRHPRPGRATRNAERKRAAQVMPCAPFGTPLFFIG